MKTELKTAEQHLNKYIGTFKNQLEQQPYLEKSILKAIESARNEPLDHLRQQLEDKVKNGKLITETPYYAGVKDGIRIGFEEAISLIDQLKAEKK